MNNLHFSIFYFLCQFKLCIIYYSNVRFFLCALLVVYLFEYVIDLMMQTCKFSHDDTSKNTAQAYQNFATFSLSTVGLTALPYVAILSDSNFPN